MAEATKGDLLVRIPPVDRPSRQGLTHPEADRHSLPEPTQADSTRPGRRGARAGRQLDQRCDGAGCEACRRSAPSSRATIALVRSFSTNSRPALRAASGRPPAGQPLGLGPGPATRSHKQSPAGRSALGPPAHVTPLRMTTWRSLTSCPFRIGPSVRSASNHGGVRDRKTAVYLAWCAGPRWVRTASGIAGPRRARAVTTGIREPQVARHPPCGPRLTNQAGAGFEPLSPTATGLLLLANETGVTGDRLTLWSGWYPRWQALRTSSSSAVTLPCHSQQSRPVPSGHSRRMPRLPQAASFSPAAGDDSARSGLASKRSVVGLHRPCRARPADAVPGRGGTGNAVRRPRPDGPADPAQESRTSVVR